MKTTQKFPTWGTYGFFKALFDFLKQVQPDGLAIAFDVSKITFRNELYTEYKANRDSMPDDLSLQMDKIREGIDLLGIPVFEVPNYEADDVIGTIARQVGSKQTEVVILTGDQDAFQIIDSDETISLMVPSFGGGLKRYDREAVFKKWGVYPEQVTDFKGLKGDTSDNIPGVPGVGDKTAAKLLGEYQTLENVLEHIDEVSGKKLKERLTEHRDQALLSKDLATIRYDVPVDFSLESCHLHIPDMEAFLKFLGEQEFKSMMTNSQTLLKPFLGNGHQASTEVTTPTVSGEDSDPDMPPEDIVGELMRPLDVSHTVVFDKKALTAFVKRIEQYKVVSFDLETSSLDVLTNTLAGISMSVVEGFSVTRKASRNVLELTDFPSHHDTLMCDSPTLTSIETVYVPVGHENDDRQLPLADVLAALKPTLEDPSIVKIAHNAKFEINTMRQHGIDVQGVIFDTMVASYVLNSNRRHGLKSLGHEVLGYHMQEITELIGTGKKQKPFTQVPIDDASPYAASDSYVTLELAARFIHELDADLTALLYEVELPLVPVLADVEWQGVSLNTAYLKSLSGTLQKQLEVLEKAIYKMAGEEFNLNSPKQVGEIFFGKLDIPAQGKTKTKSGYSTNAKVLEYLAPDYPIVAKLLEYRQLFKLKSTYIDALPNLIHPKDERIHTSYNQTVAATGRLSSSDPNLQNIPIRSELGRSIRLAFVPKDETDWVILSADYSQIELRILAHLSQAPNLIKAFKAGEDIHQSTAALVFDVPMDEVTKEQRYRAKAVNFGIIYGQTAYGLSQTLDIMPGEAAEFIATYFDQYPTVKTFIESVKQEAHQTGKARTMFGRVRDFSEGLQNKVKHIREFAERAAFNTPLQGTAADMMKVAMIRLHHALERENLQSKLIMQVHDEVVLEVYQPELEKVKDLVLWSMNLEQPLEVPLDVDISVGPTWMEVE